MCGASRKEIEISRVLIDAVRVAHRFEPRSRESRRATDGAHATPRGCMCSVVRNTRRDIYIGAAPYIDAHNYEGDVGSRKRERERRVFGSFAASMCVDVVEEVRIFDDALRRNVPLWRTTLCTGEKETLPISAVFSAPDKRNVAP